LITQLGRENSNFAHFARFAKFEWPARLRSLESILPDFNHPIIHYQPFEAAQVKFFTIATNFHGCKDEHAQQYR
jgi:hypothetical protein